MAETRQPGRGTAGGELPPASPEERLQSAFLRIARADFARMQLTEIPKDLVQVLSAGNADEKKAFALERRRLQVFDRLAVPADPGGEERPGRSRPQPSGWQGLLHELSRLLDDAGSAASGPFANTGFALTLAERKCANALEQILTGMAQSAGPPANSPAYDAALSRLEKIAVIFAAYDAGQAKVLADPALSAEEQETQLAEWASRQDEYADRLFADAEA